jgi:hypothetical protein
MLAVLAFRRGIVGIALPKPANPAASPAPDEAEPPRVASHT